MNATKYRLRRAAQVGGALLASGILTVTAAAQNESGPGWQAWLGCWIPVGVEGAEASAGEAALCVAPAGSAAGAAAVPQTVELTTLREGAVVARQQIEADGVARTLEQDGCTGWQSMAWSEDGRRLHQRSEFDCPGRLRRTSTGLFAFLPGGEWLSIEGVSAGGYTDVRVVRYQPHADPASLEPAVGAALPNRGMAVDAARTAAAGGISLANVVEAAKHLDSEVVEAWLVEQGQGFGVDARQLRELAASGTPERVIDLVVALSHPRVFAISRSTREGQLIPAERAGGSPAPRRPGTMAGWDPWYYPGSGMGMGMGMYPNYGGGWYGRPVIVVREPSSDDDSGGSLVNGRGYTRRARTGDGGASTSTPSPPRTNAQPAGRSGDGSRTGRRAKPRED